MDSGCASAPRGDGEGESTGEAGAPKKSKKRKSSHVRVLARPPPARCALLFARCTLQSMFTVQEITPVERS